MSYWTLFVTIDGNYLSIAKKMNANILFLFLKNCKQFICNVFNLIIVSSSASIALPVSPVIILARRKINPMNISRRNFVKLGSAACVFAVSGALKSVSAAPDKGGSLFALPAETFADPLFQLTSEEFKKYIGGEFILLTKIGALSAILSDLTQTVKPIQTARRAVRNAVYKAPAETFTLAFRVSGENFVQKTYRVWHPKMGEFDLFLVPHAAAETMLVAVINRI